LKDELAAARERNKKRLTCFDKGYIMLRPAEVSTLRLTGRVTLRGPNPKGHSWCRFTQVGQVRKVHEPYAWFGASLANAVYMYSENSEWYATKWRKEPPARMPAKAVRFWVLTKKVQNDPILRTWTIELEMAEKPGPKP
jgi:hypothetical protein